MPSDLKRLLSIMSGENPDDMDGLINGLMPEGSAEAETEDTEDAPMGRGAVTQGGRQGEDTEESEEERRKKAETYGRGAVTQGGRR